MSKKRNQKWDLDQPWCIGIEDYKTLTNYVDSNRLNLIVELGSGLSTFQFAEDFPNTTLVSLESDPQIKTENIKRLKENSRTSATILLAPLEIKSWKGGLFTTYDFKSLNNYVSAPIELLLIDGPVERLYPRGRESSLYFLFDKLAIGGVIGLDDYHRNSAKTAVKNWLNVFGESLVIEEETSSFIVLRKKSECLNPNVKLQLKLQSYKSLAISLYKRTRRNVGSFIKNEKVQTEK